jgi:hypothetical protein
MQPGKYGVLIHIRDYRCPGMLLIIRIKHEPDEPSPQQQKGIAEVQQCPLVVASDYNIPDKARRTVPIVLVPVPIHSSNMHVVWIWAFSSITVKFINFVHFICAKFEIKYVKVFFDS